MVLSEFSVKKKSKKQDSRNYQHVTTAVIQINDQITAGSRWELAEQRLSTGKSGRISAGERLSVRGSSAAAKKTPFILKGSVCFPPQGRCCCSAVFSW